MTLGTIVSTSATLSAVPRAPAKRSAMMGSPAVRAPKARAPRKTEAAAQNALVRTIPRSASACRARRLWLLTQTTSKIVCFLDLSRAVRLANPKSITIAEAVMSAGCIGQLCRLRTPHRAHRVNADVPTDTSTPRSSTCVMQMDLTATSEIMLWPRASEQLRQPGKPAAPALQM